MKCSFCGRDLPDDSKFCQFCGEQLNVTSDIVVSEEASSNSTLFDDSTIEKGSASSFEEIPFHFEPQFQANFPVVLSEVHIMKQQETGLVIATCDFCSLSQCKVMGMQVDIRCFNIWHEALEGIRGFEYSDILISRNESFGKDCLIVLPDKATRIIEVEISRMAFENGQFLFREGRNYPVPPKGNLSEYFCGNTQLDKEYQEKTNINALYAPKECGAYWSCTCGNINFAEEEKCISCGALKSTVFHSLDTDYLTASIKEKEAKKAAEEKAMQERAAAEQRKQQEKEAQEKKQQQAKRELEEILRKKREAENKKVIRVIAVVACLLIAITFTAARMRKASFYRSAVQQMESGEYDYAYTNFTRLGNYRDSESMAKESLYRKANASLDAGRLAVAAKQFSEITDYKDSATLALEAYYNYAVLLMDQGKLHEAYEQFRSSVPGYKDSDTLATKAEYQYALICLENEQYEEAAEAFGRVSDYEDSTEQQREALYSNATRHFENGDYEKSHDIYAAISEYKDSADLANESYYLLASELYSDGEYEKAYKLYDLIKEDSYKDSEKLSQEAFYQFALVQLSSGEYNKAQNAFEALGNYRDSKNKLQEAKYALGVSAFDRKQYLDAAKLFNELGWYKDSHDQYFMAMYSYVKANYNNSNKNTFAFLTELKKSGYKDSAKLYNELYSWSVELIAVTVSDDDYRTLSKSVNKNTDFLRFVFKLSGGQPAETVTMTHTTIWPGGSTARSDWAWEEKSDGDNLICQWEGGLYSHPEKAKAGILTIRIYNKSTGEYLGEGSVHLE